MKAKKMPNAALLATFAMALFSAQASAEWEWVTESIESNFYMDLSTRRQQSGYTLVWTIVDYSKEQQWNGLSFNSLKELSVYQCSEFRQGAKSQVLYTGELGTGNVVYSKSLEMYEVKWKDVVPETVGEIKFNRVCGISK